MRRAVAIPEQDKSCNDKRAHYQSLKAYRARIKPIMKPYLDVISGYTGGQIDQLKNSRDGSQNSDYFEALRNLQLAENTLESYFSCLNKDLILRTNTASTIYTLQSEIERLRKELMAKKRTLSEAKERATSVDKPYEHTTWWESWYPLGRPIQKDNVPVLLSVSILMLVFSLGIFFRVAGYELRFDSVANATNSLIKNTNYRKYQ